MHVIDLRSDTATRPSEAMRCFMAEAPVGDEQRNEDPTVNALQEETAALLGMEAALFLPSTTMSNQIAFKVHTRPGDEVIMDAYAHPAHFESGGLAFHSGVTLRLVTGVRGIFQPSQILEVMPPLDPHFSRPTCLALENTHNQGGGTIWPLSLLREVCNTGRRLGLALHLDGSRLFNASVATGVPAATYASPFDSVALCFSKGLGAPVGSCLVGSKALIEEARRYKHLFGGAMRQAGIIAAGALYALRHNIHQLTQDHANARCLAEGLATIPGVSLRPENVETNIVFFDVADAGLTAAEVSQLLAKEGVLINPSMGTTRLRAVTHLDITTPDIERTLEVVRRVLDANGLRRKAADV